MKSAVQSIPNTLIYEMVKGKPIYYNNYKEYLNGNKQLAEIMGSSFLQSLIISRLVFQLQSALGSDYQVMTNELGVQFAKKSWRAADIAIIKTEDIARVEFENKYLNFAPEIVIEIDTKAELKEIQNPFGYYHEKTDELLNFGVPMVVWIFTDSRKVMVAKKNTPWVTSSWSEEIVILGKFKFKIEDILDRNYRR